MPSIEIVCADQIHPLRFQEMPFAIEAESELVSHRFPLPLFQLEFDQLTGCIYHLGNPSLRDPTAPGCYTACELLSRETGTKWWTIVHFAPDFVVSLQNLLEQLIVASPVERIFFTSDYKFGPNKKIYQRPLTLRTFWHMHDEKTLKMNALYPLKP